MLIYIQKFAVDIRPVKVIKIPINPADSGAGRWCRALNQVGVGGAVDLRTMPERRSRTSALLLDALGERGMASKSCPHSLRWVGFFGFPDD